jgi:hypothetical protein
MKRILAVAGLLALTASLQAQVAYWTFDNTTLTTTTPGANNPLPGISADFGPLGSTAFGLHSGAATYSTPAGNGSAKSLSATTWAVGDYWQFSTSTIGFTGIGVSYDQTGSNTGPGKYGLFYSTDGTTFTQFGGVGNDYTVINAAWSATGSPFTTTHYTFDLSTITALDNASTVYFRVQDTSTTSINGGTVAAGGTGRIDNFTIVPEPGTAALLALGLGALILRRKSA